MVALTQTGNIVATAQIADACVRLNVPFRIAPSGINPIVHIGSMISGPVVPVRHYGSVDIFLEALESAPRESVFVIDNEGRRDEACIGDLAVLEVKDAGLSAIVVWGLHRDTDELLKIGLPIFSYGACPAGPRRLDPREPDALKTARFDDFLITKHDTAFADQDGVLFVETINVERIIKAATSIRETEQEQANAAMQGVSLREQFQFKDFLKRRAGIEGYTFRKHLASISKSIEV